MSIGLIALIVFLGGVLLGGVALALIDRHAPMGWQDRHGFHIGTPPVYITEEELQEWN